MVVVLIVATTGMALTIIMLHTQAGLVIFQFVTRWHRYLNPALDPSHWKTEEDDKLKKLILEDNENNLIRYDWASVEELLSTNRSAQAIKHRYNSLKKELIPKGRTTWTEEKDRMLMEAVQKHGTGDWRVIATYLPHCTNEQCRLRHRHLSEKNWKLAPREPTWTEKEDDELIKAVKESSGASIEWTAIANTMSTHRTAKECQLR